MQPNVCTVQKIKGDMTGSGMDKGEREEPPRPQKHHRPDPLDVLYPALQVGGLCGTFSACYMVTIITSALLPSRNDGSRQTNG